MKHLKLFESYSQIHKVEMVNNILIEYFLFNYFVENDICVISTDLVYGFNKDGSKFLWIIPDKQEVFITPNARNHFFLGIFGSFR